MRVRRQRREGADGAADLEKDVRSAEVVRRDGGTPRGQVGPASEAEVERLEPSAQLRGATGPPRCRSADTRAAWPRRSAARALWKPSSGPALRRGQKPLRRVERAGLEARLRRGQRAPCLERRVGSQSGRPLEERRCGREPAAALRSPCGALERRRRRLRRVRRRRVRGARRDGRRRARDRSPPPARRARAVVRRVTRLGTPPSAPAGGETERGRRSPAARLRPREPARSGRWRVVRPPATAARRPPADPLPPAGSVAASPRAIRRRAARTAPPAESEDRSPRAAQSLRLAPPRLILCDSSTSASGLPPVSAMIRSRTRSSSRPGTALDSSARASGSSRPSSDSCGRPSSARVVIGSRSENTIATGSASRRRATNPSACTDAASSHCASSTRHRSGRSSAVAAEQVEHGDGDQEPVRRIARRDAQGDSKRVLLRFCERLEPVEHRRAQPMDPRERQLHLRLDAFDLGDAQARGLPRGVPQQRGLSDARLAADHQDGALTVARLSEHARRGVGARLSGRGTRAPGWQASRATLKDRRGLSRSTRRRHSSRNASTARPAGPCRP